MKEPATQGNAEVFEGSHRNAKPAIDLKALHAKIGQLTPKNDLLEGALTKVNLPSAKRCSALLDDVMSRPGRQ